MSLTRIQLSGIRAHANDYIQMIRRDTFASAEEGRELFVEELQSGIDALALELHTGVPAAD